MLRWASLAERPDLASAVDDVEDGALPQFLYRDPVGAKLWPRLASDLPGYQLVILDDAETPVATAHAIPFRWSGSDDDLPSGWDAVLEQGFADLDAGLAPTAASALYIAVAKDRQGRGHSRAALNGLREAVAGYGLSVLFAPVRPSAKASYPLIPMAYYVDWTQDDGLMPFDPWLRVHCRAGGRIVGVCPESMVIKGTVAQWREWTGVELATSGRYVVEGALVPIDVDVENDVASYVEPNVWVRHDVLTV